MRIILLALSVWLCQAVTENCLRPTLEKGFFVPHKEIYEHEETISYGCDPGLKPALETWWGQITCDSGTWSHTPLCIDKTWCIPPNVANAQPKQQLEPSYPPDATVSFTCNGGFEFYERKDQANCVDGNWKLPLCKKKSYACDPPARVIYSIILKPYQDAFEHGDKLPYVCAKGYRNSHEYTTCHNGQWYPDIKCEKIKCGRPEVRHGDPERTLSHSYDVGEKVPFRCRSSYEFVDKDYAECGETGTWFLPKCTPRSAVVCEAPGISHGRPVGTLSQSYPTGASVRFRCDSGYGFEGTEFAQCANGRWNLPVCKQTDDSGGTGGSAGSENRGPPLPVDQCGDQPLIENGDVTELPSGKEFRVQCKVLYKLVGPEIVRCVSGGWTETPVCKPPCKLDRSRIHSSYPDEYLMEGERKSFYCHSANYYRPVQCINGEANYGLYC